MEKYPNTLEGFWGKSGKNHTPNMKDIVEEQIARDQAMKEQQVIRLLRHAGMEYEDIEKHGYRIVMEIKGIGAMQESRVMLTKVIATDVIRVNQELNII